ncbi:hypothetical protein FGO68_gene13110 [Halteria grandinella]|uniref:Uncharacterized protein n=1 Tax=Halteria grandinella TaxID=5974 RepID=A0A8J8P3P9_HALGN|nr:hypothetical protein FGO68_gene13110 [Halteria grandinella]
MAGRVVKSSTISSTRFSIRARMRLKKCCQNISGSSSPRKPWTLRASKLVFPASQSSSPTSHPTCPSSPSGSPWSYSSSTNSLLFNSETSTGQTRARSMPTMCPWLKITTALWPTSSTTSK